MKVTYKFNLPEEADALEIFSKADKTNLAVLEFEAYLRKELKYNDQSYSTEEYNILTKIQEKFLSILQDYEG